MKKWLKVLVFVLIGTGFTFYGSETAFSKTNKDKTTKKSTVVKTSSIENFTTGSDSARLYGVHEIVLTGNGGVSNPFDTAATVTFTPSSGVSNAITVKPFYDGGNTWRVRLYVTETGSWHWSSSSSDRGLNNNKGSFTACTSPLRGKLRQHTDNNRQWMTEDGKTFLNLSDTAYILFRSPNDPWQPVTDETFRRYVKDVVDLGINLMRAGGCGGYAGWGLYDKGTNSSYNRSNWCWEKDYDSSGSNQYWATFHLDRFQTTDRRLKWLLNNYPDMYIQLIMFGKNNDVGSRWDRIPKANQRKVIDYMVARWSAWPQVIYQIVNDMKFNKYLYESNPLEPIVANQRMIRKIGKYLARIDQFGTLAAVGAKRRLDNPFLNSPSVEIVELTDLSWHTYLHIERQADIDAWMCDKYYDKNGDFNVAMHLYYGEDWYENNNNTAQFKDVLYFYRRLFWAVLLSGGSPNYGSRYPVLHPYSQTGTIPCQIGPTTHTNQLVGLDDIIHIRDYFADRRIDLAQFVPDDVSAVVIPTPSPEPDGPSRAQCARRGRDEYLIYLPCASDGEFGGDYGLKPDDNYKEDSRVACTIDPGRTPGVTVNLTTASGTFRVEWFRPRDGVSQNGTPIQGQANRTLTSPWQGSDVVLRLLKHKLKLTDIAAHRGGRYEHPENTLYAYQHDLRVGISLDMDICKTGDDPVDIVVIHDDTTGRTTEQDWIVKDKTTEQLQTLDAAYKFDPKGRIMGKGAYPLRGRGITIPTLDEVFSEFAQNSSPGEFMWIDTKDDENYPFSENLGLYARLVELIGQHNLWEQAHIEVSNSYEADHLRSLDSRITVVFWSGNNQKLTEAMAYPHYVRIGMPLSKAIADNGVLANNVHLAGKKLHVTDPKITQSEWDTLRLYAPDSLGLDNYTTAIDLLGL